MEQIDSKGASGPHVSPGGHISRELGITMNGNIKVNPLQTMYIHSSPMSTSIRKDEKVPQKMFVNPNSWDHNFVTEGILSPEHFKKSSEVAHVLRREIKQVHCAVFLHTLLLFFYTYI